MKKLLYKINQSMNFVLKFACRIMFYSGSRNNYSNILDRNIPMSPSNYRQPPTPDHPPPTAQIAEKTILERIRPLSQVGEP